MWDKILDLFSNKVTYTKQMGMASEEASVDKPVDMGTTEAAKFDPEQFRNGILYAENRGAAASGEDLYGVVGVTGDVGKYQVSPPTLETWSEPWLGKKYDVESFKKDPEAQEKFFEQFTEVAKRLDLTPEQAAAAWHGGWGELGMGGEREERDQKFMEDLNSRMEEDGMKQYLAAFSEGINQNKQN